MPVEEAGAAKGRTSVKVAFNLLVIGADIGMQHARQLERLKALGYDAVEVPVFSGRQEHYAALGRLLADIGLTAGAAAVATPEANPVSPDPAVRGEIVAGPLHSPVGVFTGFGPTAAETDRCVEAMRAMAEYAAPAGVRISAEAVNRFECYMMSTIAEASAIHRAVNHPNYGYMFDTFHANIEEKDPPATFERYHGEINHFHVSENDRGVPGSGHVPFAAHFDALRRCGYDGWLTVESFGRALPELAGATRVWRDLFDDLDGLFSQSIAFIRREWAAAGERLA
jgi:D-psicose/D-tagatose/L-ribulose 3-epimerase